MSNPSLIKLPSAFLPLAMSLAALAIVLLHLVRFGTAREARVLSGQGNRR